MNGFSKYFYHCFKNEKELINIINDLCRNYKVIIFGGFVRDYLYKQKHNFRDIDIVVDIDNNSLKKLINKYFTNATISINQYEGYKIHLKNVCVDIWSLQNTWAIKNGYFPKEHLLKTVYLNIDAYGYELSSNSYIDNCDTKKKPTEIDICFEINPNEELNLIRSIVLSKKYKINISNSLKIKIIKLTNDKIKMKKIEKLQIDHYGKILISANEFKLITKQWRILYA